MLRRHCHPFIKKHDCRVVDPGSEDRIEGEVAAAKVIIEVLLLDGARTFVGNLVCLIADIEFGNVTLFGEFHTLLVWEFAEAPEHGASAIGLAMMEAVAAPLLLAVADSEICLAPKRLNRLFDDGFGFPSIILVGRKRGPGLGRLR